MRVSVVVLAVLAVAGFIFAPGIIAVFRGEDALVVEIGARALRFQCVAFPLMSWVIINNMLCQTIGKAAKATVLAMARQGLLILVLPPLFGVLGVQLSQPLSDLATFLLSVQIGFTVLRELKAQEEAEGGAA